MDSYCVGEIGYNSSNTIQSVLYSQFHKAQSWDLSFYISAIYHLAMCCSVCSLNDCQAFQHDLDLVCQMANVIEYINPSKCEVLCLSNKCSICLSGR